LKKVETLVVACFFSELYIKVRPVSIVSAQHFVNLARKRALEFGRTELVGPDPVDFEGQNEKPSTRDDLIVTTQAREGEVRHLNPTAVRDAFAERPRGLFADQFEVR
jgi:cysteine synthase A